MPTEIVGLLGQLPVVALVVWFVLRRDGEWRAYQSEQEADRKKFQEDLCDRYAVLAERMATVVERNTEELAKQNLIGEVLRQLREEAAGKRVGKRNVTPTV